MHRLTTWRRFPRLRIGLVLVVVLLGSGCGASKGDVSGTVTYKGKPLPAGTITFLDAKDQAVGSSSITNGKYLVGRVRTGPVRIVVTAPPVPPPGGPRMPPGFKFRKVLPEGMKLPEGKKTRTDAKGKEFVEPELPANPPLRLSIPSKYAQPETSGLTYSVQSGSQQYDIDLKD